MSHVNQPRIHLIDSLRGLALMGILLLHHIEHFDFYVKPFFSINWLIPVDQWLWSKLFLFFSGKAFALFSLLFGFSYWMMVESAKRRGEEYFVRHFWRMFLLMGFGAFHLLFFRGDILIMYAVLGLPLVLTRYMNNGSLLLISVLFLINPLNLYTLYCYISGSPIIDFRLPYPSIALKPILMGNSFIELLQSNFTTGYQTTLVWSWNVGRILMIPALFFFGCYLAKTKSFTSRPLKFWWYVLLTSIIFWLLFDLINKAFVPQIDEKLPKQLFKTMANGYLKLAIMFTVLSILVIAWRKFEGNIFYRHLSDFGRMGLTNYIFMSAIGAAFYYGWGLSLYKYCGTTLTLFIGLIALKLQMQFSSYWLSHHTHGPLEGIWRKATWFTFIPKQPEDACFSQNCEGKKC